MVSPVFIVSPPRSGSSVTASTLVAAGYYGGYMKRGDEHNPYGYFENEVVDRALTNLLRRHDEHDLGKRFNPLGLSFEQDDDLHRILSRELLGQGPWMLKNVKIGLCWRVIRASLPPWVKPRWVLVEREQEATIDSLMRTPFMDAYDSRDAWASLLSRYYRIHQSINAHQDAVHFVDASRLMRGDLCELHDLAHFLNCRDVAAMSTPIDTRLTSSPNL